VPKARADSPQAEPVSIERANRIRDKVQRGIVAGAAGSVHIAAMHNNQSDSVRITIMEGIARSVLLTARYNGQTLALAPHALFSRRGDLYVSALNLSKNWRSDDERRLGHFKLSGLAGVELNGDPFEALPLSASSDLRDDDELILAVA
jgi:hypothetical protein